MPEDTSETVVFATKRGLKAQRATAKSWTKAKERRFFAELARSANVRRALAAADASANSVYMRRHSIPAFEAKWELALNAAARRLEADLLARALTTDMPDDAMSPDALDDVADGRPAEPPMTDAMRLSVLSLHDKRIERHRAGRGAVAYVDTARLRREITERLDRLARAQGIEVKR
jgi:hypothetical protein